jgi:mannose-1-phosphate guanylyltransferase
MRYAMIMAGGAGTRLWPMSRKSEPKQLIKFIEGKDPARDSSRSLLEIAADRLEGLVPHSHRFICTSESYRAIIRRDIPSFTDAQILGEPVGRDTVNAVGFAAAVLHKLDPEATFAVLTSDHIIEPDAVFKARMDLGFKLIEADSRRLVTFSIKPTYAATGFGYVERGTPVRDVKGAEHLAFHVQRFVEKPDLARAQAYFSSGAFNWNSGMFVWRASTFLEALQKFKPESHAGLTAIAQAWGTPSQGATIAKVYPTLPKISVDYAVMEPASKDKNFQICTVQMDVRWLDVGSWPSYAETVTPDAEGNRKAGPGETLVVQGKNNLVVNAAAGPGGSPKGHTIALLGVDDLVVVHTADATLIMPRAKAEDLKTIHAMVREELK